MKETKYHLYLNDSEYSRVYVHGCPAADNAYGQERLEYTGVGGKPSGHGADSKGQHKKRAHPNRSHSYYPLTAFAVSSQLLLGRRIL